MLRIRDRLNREIEVVRVRPIYRGQTLECVRIVDAVFAAAAIADIPIPTACVTELEYRNQDELRQYWKQMEADCGVETIID